MEIWWPMKRIANSREPCLRRSLAPAIDQILAMLIQLVLHPSLNFPCPPTVPTTDDGVSPGLGSIISSLEWEARGRHSHTIKILPHGGSPGGRLIPSL